MAVTAGKIFIPEVGSSTHYYAHLCQPALGAHHGEDEEDRPAYLLPHLWRRLELTAGFASGDGPSADSRRRCRRTIAGHVCRTLLSH